MVLVGKQNKDIVLRITRHGQPAVGLCGDDGLLFTVRKQLAAGDTDIGFVGQIERVDADVLLHIAADYIPVIASVGADAEGNSYNVNADAAAAAVAEALGAFKVVFLTDVEGWRADPEDPHTRISEATAAELRERLGEVSGGMRPKLAACLQRARLRSRQRPHRRWPRAALAAASSCSRMRASGPSFGPERLQEIRSPCGHGHLFAQPVEFVRGRAPPVGRRGQRVPGLSGRHLGRSARALPPAVVKAVASRPAAMHTGNLFYTERA